MNIKKSIVDILRNEINLEISNYLKDLKIFQKRDDNPINKGICVYIMKKIKQKQDKLDELNKF